MATAQDVWGFSKTLLINVDVNVFMSEVNRQAADRGILANVPSDALDLSRDIILTDAANVFRSDWEIAKVGDTHWLKVWPRAYASEFTPEFWKRHLY